MRMRVLKKIRDIWYLLRVAFVLGSRSLYIISVSWRYQVNLRQFINEVVYHGAVRILNILKAQYSIHFETPLCPNEHYIFMSNHQSLIDIPLIYATCPGTIRPVTKTELFRIPIFGRAMYRGECIPVNRKSATGKADFINIAKEKLKSGVSIWIFPEGTRSDGKTLLAFKSGGFHLAKETAAKIVPVGIFNTKSILPKRKFSVSLNETIRIKVGKPVSCADFPIQDLQPVIQEVRQQIEKLMK